MAFPRRAPPNGRLNFCFARCGERNDRFAGSATCCRTGPTEQSRQVRRSRPPAWSHFALAAVHHPTEQRTVAPGSPPVCTYRNSIVQIVVHPKRQMRPALGGFQNQFETVSTRTVKAAIDFQRTRFFLRDECEILEVWFGIECPAPGNRRLTIAIFEQADCLREPQFFRMQILENVDELV